MRRGILQCYEHKHGFIVFRLNSGQKAGTKQELRTDVSSAVVYYSTATVNTWTRYYCNREYSYTRYPHYLYWNVRMTSKG